MAKEWFGWAGTILRIDLTKEKIIKQPLNKELAYNFLGGRGFNAKTLWDEIKPGIDPLGPENVLCIGLGPLNATLMPMSSRMNVSCKSPLTGILGDGNAGGFFSVELKFAGYDQIVFIGRAKKPVYLWIEDEDVEIRDAGEIWGKSVYEIDKILRKEHGEDIEICGIGQAGENLVRTASTMSGLASSANPGSGAVWGSKNLKAIVVRGTKGVKITKFDEFVELCKQDYERLLKFEYGQERYGTVGTAGHIRYWGTYGLTKEEFKKFSGLDLLERYVYSLKSCFMCPLHGKRFYRILTGHYAGTRGSSLEGSPLFSISVKSKIFDWAALCKANNLCDQYGLCDSKTYAAISLAMQLYEKGLITKADTDGVPLEIGNDKAYIEMIHKMALREGFGNKLAEGAYNFAKIIGPESVKYAGYPTGSSSYPVPLWDQGLGWMTSTRGPDHLRALRSVRTPPEVLKVAGVAGNLAKQTVWGQNEYMITDSLERCKCARNMWEVGVPLADPLGEGRVKMLSAATGWNVTPIELTKIGERGYNIERAFNVREGMTRKDDCPWSSEEHMKELEKYYRFRGWDLKTGIPTRAKLEELGLKYVADELEANVPYPEFRGPTLWALNKYPCGGTRVKF